MLHRHIITTIIPIIITPTNITITMNSRQLYRLLQINGGTFPTGGFSQSWGLATYVAEGIVHDYESFMGFLTNFMESSIGKGEGPIIRRAWELAGEMTACGTDSGSQIAALTELEQLSVAVKVTGESRSASIRMGKAFRRIMEPVIDDDAREKLQNIIAGAKGAGNDILTFPVLYGIVCRLLELDVEEAIAAYVFSTVNTLVQSALKLIPLGND